MRLPVALALLLLLPFAAAQSPVSPSGVRAQMSVAVDDPGRAFVPGANESLDLHVTYNVPLGGTPAPAPSAEDPTTMQPTNVTFTVKEMPSWVDNVTFEPPYLTLVPQPGGPARGSVKVIAHVVKEAPALQRENLTIVASAPPNGNIDAATAESAPITLRATVVARINVTADSPSMVVKGGRWQAIPFLVANQGNSEVTLKLNVTARPQASIVEFPATATLPVGGSQVVEVMLRLPWTYGEKGTVELEATPLLGDEEGRPGRASVDVNGQSAVPGVPVAALLVAALVVALARRTR